MTGAPRHSLHATLGNLAAVGALASIALLGAVWLYDLLAPVFNWPPFQ